MDRSLLIAASIAAALPVFAADDAGLLPAKIPGYELRALDSRKPVMLDVNGAWIEASLPVFFYYPTPASGSHAAELLRQAHDDLVQLGRKPEWTAAELQQLIGKIEEVLKVLDPKP